jgi:hypothetical protein
MDRKCLFPHIWLDEETNKCVKICPENTCRHYDENGVYKCLKKCARTSLRKLGNIIKGRHSGGIFIDNGEYYGETLIDEEPMRNGSGLMLYSNGDVYFGNWENDERTGRGVLLEANGDTYDGEWKNDKRHGKGTFTDTNGDKYKGEWLDDNMNGNGIFLENEGVVYKGHWVNNMLNGYGVFVDINGEKYEGEWRDDMKHGYGVFQYENHTKYEGEWQNDIRQGMGIVTYENGSTSNGNWINDNKNGTFIESHNGIERSIIYHNDHRFITLKNYRLEDFLVSASKPQKNKYLTIFIILHGADISNSSCKIMGNNHVRMISPITSGCLNYVENNDIIDIFNITYNVCQHKMNQNASSYQKIRNSINLFNRLNPDMFQINEGTVVKPIKDHQYRLDQNPKQNKIYLIDTNSKKFASDLQKLDFFHSFENIDEYDILPMVQSELITEPYFLRSSLINMLISRFDVDTINIIDYSCRVIDSDIYKNTSDDNPYQCKYDRVYESNPFSDETLSIGL